PLYLARRRRGLSDRRVAVKLVRGTREIGRADVQELRKDLAHYSAQMGLVVAPGEAGRDARSEASAAGQAPVALYCGEALPEEMIALRVGVTVQTVEVPDMDEAFFAGLARASEERRPRREAARDQCRRTGLGTARRHAALHAAAGADRGGLPRALAAAAAGRNRQSLIGAGFPTHRTEGRIAPLTRASRTRSIGLRCAESSSSLSSLRANRRRPRARWRWARSPSARPGSPASPRSASRPSSCARSCRLRSRVPAGSPSAATGRSA